MRSPDDIPEDRARLESLDVLRAQFVEHHEHLLAFVRWRSSAALAARRDPEEVLHDAYLRAHDRWRSFAKSGMAFRPWFIRVLRDTLFDDHDFQGCQRRDYRREVACPGRSSAQFGMGIQNPATSASLALARKERREKIDQVLGTLTPRHQEIMVLIHFGGLKTTQAAELLGMTASDAGVLHFRAREQFRVHWIARYGLEAMEA